MRWPLRLFAALALVAVVAGAHPAAATDDPYGNRQWALTQIHAPAAWSVSTGDNIKIGIVDSGVNRNHEDLIGKVIAAATCVNTSGNPAKCTTGPNDGDDINGHGTHVAGIAAAVTGNGIGVAGVAPGAKIVEARAFAPDPNGGEPSANLDDVKAGIEWVVSQGAQIVNLSVGVDTNGVSSCTLVTCGSNPLGPAVEEAWQRGALPIIASGNSNGQLFSGANGGYANLDAIVVGATGPDGSVESYSSAIGNAKWGLVAPGGDVDDSGDPRCGASGSGCPMVLSTYTGDSKTCPDGANHCYAYLSGTSMATPHVSGAAALLFAHGLTRQEVVDTLLATADPISCGTNCAGLLDAERALGAVPNDQNTGPNNGGHTTTTVKHSGVGGVVATKGGPTTTAPATSPFTFKNEGGPNTTFLPVPRAAIVLHSTPRSTKSIPVSVGFAGFVSLGMAALALSYNLRRTLTTLP